MIKYKLIIEYQFESPTAQVKDGFVEFAIKNIKFGKLCDYSIRCEEKQEDNQ